MGFDPMGAIERWFANLGAKIMYQLKRPFVWLWNKIKEMCKRALSWLWAKIKKALKFAFYMLFGFAGLYMQKYWMAFEKISLWKVYHIDCNEYGPGEKKPWWLILLLIIPTMMYLFTAWYGKLMQGMWVNMESDMENPTYNITEAVGRA